ncbi:hypothetical protein JN11_03921 [Mucilaginibacter frigoritolerans]|uniref:Uncharacterized protein n=1 Tax=Mucilaginibacter frigoritolerans TaxID=652788 RepID=A0A562TU84_9SPHI|nr:hypothetical protein [Mucilaginibacter frigoritolerans]TWI96808.1 hypothetical protein JN11_03921 [Mucilaginibacter frigoritolerans]
MKTIEKKLYHRPELDTFLAEKLKEIGQHVIINAESYAVRNKPSLAEQNISSYYQEDHLKYQELIGEIGIQLQVKTLISEVIENDQLTERQVHALQNKVVSAKEKQVAIERELQTKQPPTFSTKRIVMVWLLISVPLLADGLFSMGAFESYGYTYLEAAAISLLFACSLTLLAHFFERLVAFGKNLWQRRVIASGILIGLAIIFYYMASARVQYLAQAISTYNHGATLYFSPLPFAILSLLFFVISVAINKFLYPKQEQRMEMLRYEQQKKAAADNKAEISRLEQEIETVKQSNADLRHVNGSIVEYGCKAEEIVIASAFRGWALWRKTNLMRRQDNARPIGFNSDEYPFGFITNFKSLNLF